MGSDTYKNLKKDILSLLTDKNIGFVQVEGKTETFGALIALGYAFKKVNEVLEQYDFSYRVVKPKAWNAKHYSKWMRRGECPGCGVGCGSLHQENCKTRAYLISQL